MRQIIIERIMLAILLMAGVVSCNGIEDDFVYDNEIRLKASVSANKLVTKGEGVISSSYEDPLHLGFVRTDETASGYPEDFRGQPALTATMQGVSDIKEINFNEVYQSFESEIYGVRYASWYPWYETAAEEASGLYKYDQTNAQVTIPIDGSTDILYGSVVSGTRTSGFNTIEYDHALVKYRITAYALVPYDDNKEPIAEYLPDVVWGSISDVTVVDMPPVCVMALPEGGGSEYELTYPYTSENLEDYTMSGEGGAPLLESIPIIMDDAVPIAEIIAAPPVDGILKINVTTSKTSASQQITIARDFKPGRHYDVRLRFSNHGLINADIVVSEWGEAGNVQVQTGGEVFFDLSSTESANCYMVSSANYNYCFDVTVKGNGASGVLDGSDTALDPGYVDVVWMDKCLEGVFELASNFPSQGRALFKLKGDSDVNIKDIPDDVEGNVLIGAYSDESKSELLWTWHVWISDRPQIQSYKNGFTVQDRDLGAVDYESATDSRMDGLYYQWGRPTPFPIGRTLSDTYAYNITESEEVPDVQTSISNPSVFYKDAVVAPDNKTYRLWGWRSTADEYMKTIYDPCPAGYRIPSKRLWTELEAEIYSISGHNVEFSVIDGYSIYYPISGYYNGPTEGLKYYWNGSDSRSDKVGAFMWSATYEQTVDNPYLMTYEYHTDGSHGMITRPANDDGPALPVRCVAERSTPHVEDLSAFQTANSYIIDESGYYKFDVTVRGNGVGYLVSPGTSESIDLTEGQDIRINVNYVDFLWWQGDMETGNKEKTPPVIFDFDGKPVDGFVTFHIDEYREGNLIVAGYDEKGVILWTWHLWLTDTPVMKKSKDYEVMDRFLGATYAPASVPASSMSMSDDQWEATLGFYYQWGRKDPFPACDRSGRMASWWKYDRTTKDWTISSAIETTEAASSNLLSSINNPMNFHLSTMEYADLNTIGPVAGVTYNYGSYFSEDNNIANRVYGTMVNDVSESFWGYSSSSGFGKTTTKTMYDPCPPGYSVAYYLVWAGSYSGLDGWSQAIGGTEYNSSCNGLMLDSATFGYVYDYTWYPFAGYMDAHTAQYREVGTIGRFYSSTPANKGSRSFFYNEGYTGQMISNNYTGISTTFALPVRCQKD